MESLEEKSRTLKNIDFNDNCLNLIDKDESILCNHCLRTAANGIRCMGICVADNDY
tara:strand:- start:378 stop:545 length:168 start_codon:yes stop_codon:yes gene_type:complete